MVNVNEWVIAGVFAVSALIYAARKQWENVVTRLFIAMFYAALGLNIVSAMDVVRPLSRWFVFLLGAVEVVSYLARRYMDKKTKRG